MTRIKALVVSPVLVVAMALVSVSPASAADPVSERRDGFEASKDSIAAIEDAIEQGDRAVIAEHAESLAVFAERIPDLFPEGSRGGFFSRARGSIWSNFPDFVKKSVDFERHSQQLVQAATSPETDDEILYQRLEGVTNSCAACHQNYRWGR